MMTHEMSVAMRSDAELVTESLAGNREAFGQIVTRYQSLICSLVYSATGSLGQSEDLAQETFITAWKHLRHLREPNRLRAWLCGIARNRINNFLRREGREPIRAAEQLEEIAESHSPEPLPADHVISKEEAAILWRSLERIPETYREPLILFYREHQSIGAVAESLELSEDAVKQRLSRGRKLLQDQVLAFVEGALERTNPGKAFTIAVVGSLPALTFSAKAATASVIAAKSTTAKAGIAGALGVFLAPLVVLFPNYLCYRIGLAEAESEQERREIKSVFTKVGVISLALFMPLAATILWLTRNDQTHAFLGGMLATGMTLVFLPTMLVFVFANRQRRRVYNVEVLAKEHGGVFPPAAWEYQSRLRLFGLPLIHVRIGDRFGELRGPVVAWISIANYAVGGLFAFGGLAVAPISIGGLALGGLAMGGFSVGVITLGGITLGVWAVFGGLSVGWKSFGCIAIGWKAAAGDFSLAVDFAAGRFAYAAQANNAVERAFMRSDWVFQLVEFVNRHWLWMCLLWIVPLSIQWAVITRKRRGLHGNS